MTFDVAVATPDLDALRTALNALLGPEVAVRSVVVAPADFDARFSACWRRYRYDVLDDEVPDPFIDARSWWIRERLDLDAMNRAAQALVGEHDFSSFCRRPRRSPEVSLVRRVHAAGWTRPDVSSSAGVSATAHLSTFEIVASAFCHQMVRSIVGTLVKVGSGRMTVEQVPALLGARARDGAPPLAPPAGPDPVGGGLRTVARPDPGSGPLRCCTCRSDRSAAIVVPRPCDSGGASPSAVPSSPGRAGPDTGPTRSCRSSE